MSFPQWFYDLYLDRFIEAILSGTVTGVALAFAWRFIQATPHCTRCCPNSHQEPDDSGR